MNLFSKNGVVIAAILFAVWILVPMVLGAVCHLLNSPGRNLGLLIGFLKMVTGIGIVFALTYAVAAYFGKPWLLASPILYVLVSSVVGHFRPVPPLHSTQHAPYVETPAAALADEPGVSLEALLHFSTDTMTPATAKAVAKVAQARQGELAAHLLKDRGFRHHALYAAALLSPPHPDVLAAVRVRGQELAAGLRRFNQSNHPSDCTQLAPLYRDDFRAWSKAWLALHGSMGSDGSAPLQELIDLSAVRSAECPAMSDLHLAAQSALRTLAPNLPR